MEFFWYAPHWAGRKWVANARSIEINATMEEAHMKRRNAWRDRPDAAIVQPTNTLPPREEKRWNHSTMSYRLGLATTTRIRTAWYQRMPWKNCRSKGASLHRTWKRQTTAPRKTRRSATLRLVLAPPTRCNRSDPG